MSTFMWAPTELKWEPIGKFGLAGSTYRNFVWLTGPSEVAHCFSYETARVLAKWLNDAVQEYDNAKQKQSTTEDDAGNRTWR